MAIFLFLLLHWYLSLFGQTFYLHRYSAHKMFTMSKFWEKFWYIYTWITQGTSYLNARAYAILHRMHHAYSDTDRDPHSPYYKSRWSIQFLSYFNQVKTKYIVDLGRDSRHLWFYHWYWAINLIWFALLFAIDPALVGFWMAVIGLTVFKMHTINSLCHRTPWYLWPIRNDTNSSNSVLLVLLNINNGEAWHKNHHQNSVNYRFGQRWYEIDPPARIIEMLVQFKMASINRK